MNELADLVIFTGKITKFGEYSIAVDIADATLAVPKNPAVRRAWIIFQLRLRGSSLARLARENEVTHQAVSNALMVPNSHLEPVIASALGVDETVLFPERFDATGNRLAQTRAQQRNTPARARNISGRGAA